MNQEGILQNEIVQIKHTVTGNYLMSTGFNYQEKGFLFGSTIMLNNYYVVCADDPMSNYTLWKIEKLFDDSSEINYGDFVFLKNLNTKQYLTYDYDKSSEVSGQIRVTLTENKAMGFPFYLQAKVADGAQIKHHVQSNDILKLKATRLNVFLHSHEKNYYNKNIKYFNEISCSTSESDKNYWQIEKLSESKRQIFDINMIPPQVKNNLQEIRDSDKIIIRNYWTGYSLHSHKDKYASTGNQEVTCFQYERDGNFDVLFQVNDWWVIQLIFHTESKIVTHESPIKLVHQQTIQYLTVDTQRKAKSKNGQQVRCTQTNQDQQFILSTLDNQPLSVGKLFFIFFPQMNLYLSQGPAVTEMQKVQYEVVMVDKFSPQCCWMIEKKIS